MTREPQQTELVPAGKPLSDPAEGDVSLSPISVTTTLIEGAPLDASLMQVSGSSFRNSYQRGQVDQGQFRGKFKLDNGDSIDFGLALTDVKNRSAYGYTQRDTWGGATSPADYPDTLWHPDTLSHYFSQIGGSNNPAFYNQFFTWDFNTVRDLAVKAINDPSALGAQRRG